MSLIGFIDSRYSTTQNIAGSLYIFSGTVSDNDGKNLIYYSPL